MKIASKIRPRSGKSRRVSVHGRLYVFAPTLDRNEETHFVCEVKNPDAAETLVSSGDYYPFGHDLEPIAMLQRAPSPAPLPIVNADPAIPPQLPVQLQTTPPADTGQNGGAGASTTWPTEIVAEATELLKGSATDISTAVGRVSHADVIKAAQDLEAKAEKPRANVQKLLESTLQGIIAAKVGG